MTTVQTNQPSTFSQQAIPPWGRHFSTEVSLHTGRVTATYRDGSEESPDGNTTEWYEIDTTRTARQAASCLLRPEVGDWVLISSIMDDVASDLPQEFILSILERSPSTAACLEVPTADSVTLRSEQLKLQATESMEVSSLKDMAVNAPFGTMQWNALNLFSNVTGSWIQRAHHHIQKAHQFALDVKQLLRLHGKHQLITADQDIKIDGERINMG